MTHAKANGIDRTHAPSLPQKVVFIGLHCCIVLTCFFLAFDDGLTRVGELFGQHWQFTDPQRALLLASCALLYWLRHAITLFYLLQRKISWEEALGLLIFFVLFEIGLLLLGGGAFRPTAIVFNWVDGIALMLLLLGSYLNTYSELQRKWWKAKPTNKGLCYTAGLFRHAMHINFFGDIVLFTGWCLLTHNAWSLALPLLMAIMFIFHHIPTLDAYLSARYGEPFNTYQANTKKLIPYVY